MTRLVRSLRKPVPPQRKKPRRGRAVWALQDAKARFSEVVRRARAEGPQHVTTHGKETVVILSAEEYGKLTIHAKYPTLTALLADSPLRDVEFGRRSSFPPVRPPVDL